MGTVFIGHASANNAEAAAVASWMKSEGWTDYFLDLDPERGIVAGEKWQRSLKEAAERCELVLFVISPDWVRSKWCLAEFLLARQLSKQIMGVIVAPTPIAEIPAEMTAEWQLVDLTAGERDRRFDVAIPPGETPATVFFATPGLARLKAGLRRAGLDPSYFDWPPESDPGRPPYRGLRPLEGDDAGIFFGREGPTIVGLDRLRGMRQAGTPEILVILGASGSGKSSFMRAGLLPRLARDDQHFLPLPVIRPDRAVITGDEGLLTCLETATDGAGLKVSRAEIGAAVQGGAATLGPLLARLVERRRPRLGDADAAPPPTVVFAVDQAEELFAPEGADEAGRFLTLLRDLAAARNPPVIILFAIRTDSYEALQTAKQLDGASQQFLSLPPMPAGAFGDVIRGPSRRLAATKRPLRIEETLVDALLADIEAGGGKDALPLLAFTLERLYREHGGDGDLRLDEYTDLGGVAGSIEAAVEDTLKVAGRDPAVPRDREAQLALLRRGLIPWLAGIDPDTGSPRRRVARLSEIPPEARPLVRLLIEQRLLSSDRDRDTGEMTVEPAHEALLRQWGLLEGWLAQDLPVLTTIESVRRATRDWAANGKRPEWLVHSGERLADADAAAAREDVGKLLQPTEHAYLAAARAAGIAARDARIRAQRRRRIAAAAAVVLLAAAAGGVYWFQSVAAAEARRASASLSVVRSQMALRDDDVGAAVESGIAALDTLESLDTRSAALSALIEVSPNLEGLATFGGERPTSLAWVGPDTVAVATAAKKVYRVGAPAAGQPAAREQAPAPVADGTPQWLKPLPGGGMAMVLDDGRIVGRQGAAEAAATEARVVVGQHAVDASADGAVIARATFNDGIAVEDCPGGGTCRSETLPVKTPSAVAVSPDGSRLAVGDESGAIRVFARDGNEAAPAPIDAGAEVRALDWSAGGRLAAGTAKGELLIVDGAGGPAPAVVFRAKLSPNIQALRWSPVRDEVAAVCDRSDVCLVAADGSAAGTWRAVARFAGAATVTGLRWSPDGSRLATIDAGDTLRFWSREPDRSVRHALATGGGTALRSLDFDPVKKRLAAGGDGGAVWVWEDGADVAARLEVPEDFGRARVTSVGWGPSGELQATFEKAGLVIYPPGGGTPRVEKFTGARLAAWVGGTVAVPLNDGRIALVAPDPAVPVAWAGPIAEPKEPWNVIGLPEGRTLLASYTDGSLQVWDIAAKAHTGTLLTSGAAGAGGDGAGSLTLSPDGRWVAATRIDSEVVAYDVAGESAPRRFALARDGTNTVAFSPDGRRLAGLGSDGRLYVWDFDGGELPVLAVTPVAERSEAGRMSAASGQRPAAWIDWLDADHLAVATIAGTVEVLSLDPDRWHGRASLFAMAQ